MREIKYRAWDKEEKEMLELVTVGCTRKDNWGSLYIKNGFVNGFDHNNYDIMQSAGLKDKNGVDVFEGDYLSWISFESRKEFKGEVVFSKGSFCMVVRLKGRDYKVALHELSDSDDLIEVLGNIWEDGDLLDRE